MYIYEINLKVLIKYIIKNAEVHNLNKVHAPIKTYPKGIGLRAVNGYLKEATNTNERIRYVANLI